VQPLLEQVLESYPSGVKLVYKYFPLRNHKFGMAASMAAWAAGRQGKFWEMHDLIFKNYNALSQERFTEFAKQIGLDMDKFAKDQKDPEGRRKINADLQEGVKAGVRGTPTIFVNGKRLKNRSFNGIKQMIDTELKKAAR